MKLSVEILDHIFSFLVSDRTTLIACSKDPVLSQIVERHLYYHITVYFDIGREHSTDFTPARLSRFIFENPRILYHVRILKIQVTTSYSVRSIFLELDPIKYVQEAKEFATTLLKFPVLECIQLITPELAHYNWPDVVQAALEDRLKLPTLKEVHIVGMRDPCSLIDNCQNIENLLLSGSYLGIKCRPCASAFPQLRSLTLLTSPHDSFLASFKLHLKELRSLKCASDTMDHLPELLEVCSQKLAKLDIDLFYATCYSSNYLFRTGQVIDRLPLPELSPVPPNLQQLTIRAGVAFEYDHDRQLEVRRSYLQTAVKIINLFVASLQHLILDIPITLRCMSDLAEVDFLPLVDLGAASRSIPRIDLYVHTGFLLSSVTLAQLLSSLAGSDISRSIEEGRIVVHPEEIAPEYVVSILHINPNKCRWGEYS